MKAVLGLLFLGAVYGQNFIDTILHGINGRNDIIHSYSFEYHHSADLLLIRNSSACFIVHVDSSMSDKLSHKDSKEELEDQLYMQIKSHKGETLTDIDELRHGYQDNRAVFECFSHDVFKLQYTSV